MGNTGRLVNIISNLYPKPLHKVLDYSNIPCNWKFQLFYLDMCRAGL